MHALHLFRAVDNRGEAYDIVADFLIISGVCRSGHDIGASRTARERLCNDVLYQSKCFSVNICGPGIIRSRQNLHLQIVFLCFFPDNGKALLHALMWDESHIGRKCRLLGNHVTGIRPFLHREGDRCLQHGTALRGDGRHCLDKDRLKEPQIPEYQLHAEIRIRCKGLKHSLNLGKHFSPEGRVCFHIGDKPGQSGNRRSPGRS